MMMMNMIIINVIITIFIVVAAVAVVIDIMLINILLCSPLHPMHCREPLEYYVFATGNRKQQTHICGSSHTARGDQ